MFTAAQKDMDISKTLAAVKKGEQITGEFDFMTKIEEN